ncbi:hypothetical protein CEXT_530931 [Caerostris extrusa]|uniref:Uncharacterized protein n=1 Tax=Caerostris extrusa TaxID=172846 RepID=A0AAV4NYJ8_CAEEX|nr:hypothetical protein CEXT_530931 [Caerostris extrusa]
MNVTKIPSSITMKIREAPRPWRTPGGNHLTTPHLTHPPPPSPPPAVSHMPINHHLPGIIMPHPGSMPGHMPHMPDGRPLEHG